MKRLPSALPASLALGALTLLLLGCPATGPEEQKETESERQKIVYGVSPYQDTILPALAEEKGWYDEEGLDVEIKVLEWGDVMGAVAAGGVDVAIQNFNSFQAAYGNIAGRGGDIVFYHPLFVFKGAAIVARQDSDLRSYSDFLKAKGDARAALEATVEQFRGLRIIATKATEMEQVVLTALDRGGIPKTEVELVHAQPADGLNAFLAGEADLYSGGVTEQLQAYSKGARQILSAAEVGLVVIDGIVTRRSFVDGRRDDLHKLLDLWYRTTSYVNADPLTRGQEVISYLNKVASYKFSAQDYEYTWRETEIFPVSHEQARDLWFVEGGPYYWKDAWDANNSTLVESGDISTPVPYEAFLGDAAWKAFSEDPRFAD